MNYLEQIIGATKSHNAGIKRSRENVNRMLTLLTAQQAAEQAMAQPVASPVGSSGVPQAPAHASHAGEGSTSPGGFDPNFNNSLQRLLKDFGGKVTVKSGYRSPERQAQLWQQALKKYGSAAVARKWVAPPGKSNHNRGLAADLGFADKNTIAAVHAAASKYGLVFPLSNENWHIEPISARKR